MAVNLFLIAALCAPAHATTSFTLVAGTTTGLTGIITSWYDNEATRQSDATPDFWMWGIEFWDYNQDGCQDLFFQNHDSDFHVGGTIARQTKTGNTCTNTYTDQTTSLIADKRSLPVSAGKARLVDFDKNGFPDIIGAFNATGVSLSYRNSGTALTALSGPYIVNSYPNWRTSTTLAEKPLEGIVDINSDGYPDVVSTFVDSVGGTASAYRFNPSNNQFVQVSGWYSTPVTPEVPQSITDTLTTLYAEDCGEEASANNPGHRYVEYDTNNDGFMDLILVVGGAYGTRRESYLLIRQSDGTTDDVTADVGLSNVGQLAAVADFDGDGRLDLVFAGGANPGIYSPNSTFTTYTRISQSGFPNTSLNTELSFFGDCGSYSEAYGISVIPVDFDRDGDLDILQHTMRLGRLVVYDNNGSGAMTSILTLGLSGDGVWDAQGVAMGDVDNDGMMDIVVGRCTGSCNGGGTGYYVSTYLNDANIASRQYRLYMTPALETIWEAKKNANDSEWQALKTQADTLVAGSVPAYDHASFGGYGGSGWLDSITKLGIANHAANDTTYCTKVGAMLDSMNAPWNDSADTDPVEFASGYSSRNVLLALAIGWSMCYDQLDATQRTETIATGNAWYDWLNDPANVVYEYETYEDILGTEAAYGNYHYGHEVAIAAWAYATLGDNDRAGEILWRFRELFQANFPATVLESGGSAGGYAPDSSNYGLYSFQYVLDAMRFGENTTGNKIYDFPYSAEDIAKKFSHNLIHDLRPNYWQTSVDGEFPGDCAGVLFTRYPLMFSGLIRTTHAEAKWMKYMYSNIVTAPACTAAGLQAPLALEKFIYYTAASSDAYSDTEPLYYYAKGANRYYTRSGWTTSDIWLTINGTNDNYASHQIRCAGHIELSRGTDMLLVNAGSWKGSTGVTGSPYSDSTALLANHRCGTLFVDDGGTYQYTGEAFIGGQAYWGTNYGMLLHQEHADDYDYFSTQLYPAYDKDPNNQNPSTRPVQSFKRNVLALGTTSLVVVYDNVTMVNSSCCTKKFFWHGNPTNEPTIDDTADTFKITNGSSDLHGTVLLPATVGVSAEDDKVESYAGSTELANRVVIADPATSATLRVLTVLEPKASGGSATAATLITSTGTTMYGAVIATSAPKIALFSASGSTVSSVVYTAAYTGVGTHVIADLTASTNFYWLRTGDSFDVRTSDGGGFNGPVASSDDGVLTFESGTAPVASVSCCKASN